MAKTIDNPVKPKKRLGRPPVIGPAEERAILAVLRVGASLNDACKSIEIGRQTLTDKFHGDEAFRLKCDQAAVDGKIKLIKKVGRAAAWQAAAWMLTRKYPKEYAERAYMHNEVTGKGGGPVQTETTHTFDYDKYASMFAKQRGLARNGEGTAPTNRN